MIQLMNLTSIVPTNLIYEFWYEISNLSLPFKSRSVEPEWFIVFGLGKV